MYVCMYVCMYVYICRERERGNKKSYQSDRWWYAKKVISPVVLALSTCSFWRMLIDMITQFPLELRIHTGLNMFMGEIIWWSTSGIWWNLWGSYHLDLFEQTKKMIVHFWQGCVARMVQMAFTWAVSFNMLKHLLRASVFRSPRWRTLNPKPLKSKNSKP